MTQDVAKVDELARELRVGPMNDYTYSTRLSVAQAILESPTIARMMEEARANERAAIVAEARIYLMGRPPAVDVFLERLLERGEHTETGS